MMPEELGVRAATVADEAALLRRLLVVLVRDVL
jgi:hypothetical protein